jgi:hypothetical protein
MSLHLGPRNGPAMKNDTSENDLPRLESELSHKKGVPRLVQTQNPLAEIPGICFVSPGDTRLALLHKERLHSWILPCHFALLVSVVCIQESIRWNQPV